MESAMQTIEGVGQFLRERPRSPKPRETTRRM
jgi:hypothetical protein